jgi:steroid delta-isomerase-like uncharacterized protein
MSTEDNKALTRRYIEVLFNQKDLKIIDELCVPDVLMHSTLRTIQGLEAFTQYLSMFLPAFPDLQVVIEDQLAEGNKSAYRYWEQGTHTADFMGIKASGKQFHSTGIMIIRHAEDGKIVEAWDSPDTLAIVQQLGMVSARESAS